MSARSTVDLAIVGGGIAGLWLANLFAARGYSILLLEAAELGSGQTLASQGMIHGGVKYSLSGSLSAATQAISAMPARWRHCLAGHGELDLSGVEPLSQQYYLFAQDSTLDKLSSFFASKALRGRVAKVHSNDYPDVFKAPGFRGVVYAVDELVIDSRALLQRLHERIADRAFCHTLAAEEVQVNADHVALHIGNASVNAQRLVLCAGAGNAALIQGLGLAEPQMQRRPLHQVMVHHDHLQTIYAHCLTGIRRAEPRLTITSHPTARGMMWYLGGQLASDGVDMTADALAAYARQELDHCVPWLAWNNARFATLRVDRAEPLKASGTRPDEAFAEAHGPVLVCWPTKLSLTPDLGDRVQSLLDPPSATDEPVAGGPTLNLPRATVGHAPWEG